MLRMPSSIHLKNLVFQLNPVGINAIICYPPQHVLNTKFLSMNRDHRFQGESFFGGAIQQPWYPFTGR